MHQLNDALDSEIQELDTVLLRLTTLRLLMAAGKHQMVERSVVELDDAMSAFEVSEREAVDLLRAHGYETLSEAAGERPPAERGPMEGRAARLKALHREVRVALATTGAAAERALRSATDHLDGAPQPTLVTHRHPFLTGD